MPDTIKVTDELSASGLGDQQARAIMRAYSDLSADFVRKSEFEKLIVRIDGMDRWMKFCAAGIAVLVAKTILG